MWVRRPREEGEGGMVWGGWTRNVECCECGG